MTTSSLRRRVEGITTAILCTALANVLRWALDSVPDDAIRDAPFYLAVLITTLIGGAACGLLTAMLALLADIWLAAPGRLGNFGEGRLALFLLFTATTTFMAGRLRSAREQASAKAKELQGSRLDAATRQSLAREMHDVLRHARTFVTHATATAPPGWDDAATTWGVERYRWVPEVPTPEAALEVIPLEIRPGEAFYDAWLKAKHPDDFQPTAAALTQAIRSGVSSVTREFRALDKYGRTHWFKQVCAIDPVSHGCWRVTAINTDITDRREAEQAQVQRAEELQRLLDVVPAAVWVTHDPECRVIVGNWRANQYYEAESDENVSASTVPGVRHFFAPDGRELSASDLPMQVAVATNQEVRNAEVHVLLPSGRRATLLGDAIPLRDAHGAVRGCICAFMDITQRKQVEDDMRRLARDGRCDLWQATVIGLPGWDTPQALDPKANLIQWTDTLQDEQAATAVLDLDVRPGETWANAAYRSRFQEDNTQMYATMVRALQTGARSYEQEFRCRDRQGETQWLFERTTLLPLGPGQWRFSGVTINVTERKRMEETLREVTRHARCILNVGEAVAPPGWQERLSATQDIPFPWHIEVANVESAQEVIPLALAPGESYQTAWWRSRHPEDRAKMDRTAAAAFLSDLRGFHNDFRCTDRHGREHWMYQTVVVHPVGDGRWRTFGIAIDVTERKQAEEQLAAAKASAEQAKAAAEAASAAKDHFLAVLSHELRTPLTPVVTSLALLQGLRGLDEPMRESLEMIHRNVILEARLIDDLLDVTRIARGKIELDRRPVWLSDVLRQAVEVVGPDLEARQLHFSVEAREGPYLVDGDATRLEQVFWNLLRNAIKFTPHGGRVGVYCWRENGHVVTEVRDTGEGISPADLSRIFNAFEQAERSAARQFGGLGLGLTISKALVELHGGAIEALSEGKGRGAAFRVRLPLVTPQQQIPTSPIPPATAVRPLRILLVEDHGDTARAIRQLLMRHGHSVQKAGDVATALEIAATEAFDLLISDLGLPDGSGLDLLRELRARGCSIPAIALSGYGQEQDIQRSRQGGFSVHLVKPASQEHICEAIVAAVGARTGHPGSLG